MKIYVLVTLKIAYIHLVPQWDVPKIRQKLETLRHFLGNLE